MQRVIDSQQIGDGMLCHECPEQLTPDEADCAGHNHSGVRRRASGVEVRHGNNLASGFGRQVISKDRKPLPDG